MKNQKAKTQEKSIDNSAVPEQQGEVEEFEVDNSQYKFKLEQFEGPLDLLLHLIKEAKIDIKDIFISKITEQFLAYINEIKDLPLEKIGDFLEMSATLLEIKSKKLLPIKEELPENEEDPEQKLIRQLEEYKIFKEKSEILQTLDDTGKFYKNPEPTAGDYRYELKDLSFEKLIDAFVKIMHRIEIKAEMPTPKMIQKDRFTVAQKISEIKDLLESEKKIKFSSLYASDYSKSEVINTFLALLELLKSQVIKATQNETFGEIEIEKQA